MSIRSLPAIPALTLPAGLSLSEIAPSAIAKWQSDIRAASEQAENVISILDDIGSDFFGEGVTARRISAALRSIGNSDITVHLNSRGGDFFEGLAIYNLLRAHKSKVTVKVLGLAGSIASIIAMAGDTVEVPRAGFLMMHNTWAMAIGNRHDMREFADTLEPFDLAMADVYAARSGLEPKVVQKMMDRETWIGGSEAVEKGFADALLPADEVAKDEKAALEPAGPNAASNHLKALLAKAGKSRSQAIRLLDEYKNSLLAQHKNSGTPSAADDATPGAGEMASALDVLKNIKF